MAHDVVLIPGDGIGPEITQAMRRVVEATGVQINWNVQEAGAGVMDEFGTPLPQHVLDAVAETKVAIKGPITTPVGTGFRSVNVALRKHFDLGAVGLGHREVVDDAGKGAVGGIAVGLEPEDEHTANAGVEVLLHIDEELLVPVRVLALGVRDEHIDQGVDGRDVAAVDKRVVGG